MAQVDNLEQIDNKIVQVLVLLSKNLQHGGPEKPFGLEKKEFSEMKKRISAAIAKVLIKEYTVSLFLF